MTVSYSVIIDPYTKCYVYKLLCDDCNKWYIGQTWSNFKTTFKVNLMYENIPKVSSTHTEHFINQDLTLRQIYES